MQILPYSKLVVLKNIHHRTEKVTKMYNIIYKEN